MGMNEMAFGNGEPGIAGRRTERGGKARERMFFSGFYSKTIRNDR